MQKINLILSGLTCPSCQKLSKMKLEGIEGVKEAKVELDGKTEVLAEREINLAEFERALENTPYKITSLNE